MHTICFRSPIDESSPLPYKSIRQPLENAHSYQALCSLMAVLRASAAHRLSETFPMRLVVAREYANWGAFQHAFTRRAGASVAATSAWFDAVAAGTENAHMQSAESCN
ncbi:AMM_1a_G0037090.mRNA.1.CDS.1 [Saccharomyces cerevisiae]|nr:AMM_1a_G0037090.mRNA.1.CDS.1 [Saccharomyces cerevisiae]CAI6807360.1 AMM_1a_G0037090.mRNA.1.CDS.1 [Saccharomyces cerevisiae]